MSGFRALGLELATLRSLQGFLQGYGIYYIEGVGFRVKGFRVQRVYVILGLRALRINALCLGHRLQNDICRLLCRHLLRIVRN